MHTFEKRPNNETVCYRNGEPIMMAITCMDKDNQDFKNVIALKRIKPAGIDEIISAIFGIKI